MIAVRNFTTVYAQVTHVSTKGIVKLDPNYEGYQYAIDYVIVNRNMFGGVEPRVGDIFGLQYSEIEEGNPVLADVYYVMYAGEAEAIKYDPKEGGF